MDRISTVLGEIEKALDIPEVAGRARKLQFFLLFDGYRTAYSAVLLANVGRTDRNIPSDAVEALVRKVVELTIIFRFVATCGDGTVVDRFLKTSATKFEHSFKSSNYTEDKNLDVSMLPDYRQMDEFCGNELYAIYQKLSHLCHPREVLPYSLTEFEISAQLGIEKQEYYLRRTTEAIEYLSETLELLLRTWHSGVN